MVEPLLKDMSNDDLNQRYANSYVLYNKTVYYISGFIIGNKGQPILVGTDRRGRDTNLSLEFDWQLLDTSRPESKWYEWAGALMHLSYQPRRQYSRGICRNNTVLWTPRGGHAIHHDVVTALYNPAVRTYGHTPAQVLDATNSILSKQMAMINNTLYYRSSHIGEKRDRKLFLNNPSYFQDFKDIGLGGIIEYDVKEQKKKSYTSLFQTTWAQPPEPLEQDDDVRPIEEGFEQEVRLEPAGETRVQIIIDEMVGQAGGRHTNPAGNGFVIDWNAENAAFAERLRVRREQNRQDELARRDEELNRALGLTTPPPPRTRPAPARPALPPRDARGRIIR